VALKAFCTTCQRTVYIDDGDTPVCPVCSNPLIETTTDTVDEDKDPEKA
jgi:RNA polymerase subunit RPABC4/transcription elongation factor Spt4